MTLAIALLVAGLVFFLVSTRQFKQPERFIVWLIGAMLCVWSGWLVATQPGHYGLFRAIADASQGDAIASVFARNLGSVEQFIPQLLDLFVIAAGAIGLVALIAFTPGQDIEQATRPAVVALLGFIAGGFAALAVVAIGLGGQVRPRSYLGQVPSDAVYDGDTFQMGEVSLRLWGVDAPELGQECRGVELCGERARVRLTELVAGALVQCDQKESRRTRRLTESFGRPLVRCWVRREGERPFDLGDAMIRMGYAVQYRGETSYGYSAAEQAGMGRALLAGCMLRPDLWRNDNAARRAFEQNEDLPEGAALVGQACIPPEPPPATLAGAPRGGELPLESDDDHETGGP